MGSELNLWGQRSPYGVRGHPMGGQRSPYGVNRLKGRPMGSYGVKDRSMGSKLNLWGQTSPNGVKVHPMGSEVTHGVKGHPMGGQRPSYGGSKVTLWSL